MNPSLEEIQEVCSILDIELPEGTDMIGETLIRIIKELARRLLEIEGE
jgi:hypothetical protein